VVTTLTGLRQRVAEELARAGDRTLALADVDESVQRAQVSPLMSPLVWDLAHIANYEELWLVRALDGRAPIDPALDDLYNAFEHPRWERPALPVLGPVDARRYRARVRADVLELLACVDLDDDTDPLRHQAFVYGMVLQHEHQHCETMLATHQLRGDDADGVPGATGSRPRSTAGALPEMVRVDAGPFLLGTDTEPWAYDNERGSHEVALDAFWLDTTPVTNEAYLAFVRDGGYDDQRWWSERGWAWRLEADLRAPQFWEVADDGGVEVLRFGRRAPLAPDEPVQHVCYWEADAYARWAGKRLPTEAEWEKAATWHPTDGKRRYPWGDDAPTAAHANLGAALDGPAPVGAYPAGASPWGAHQLVGDVWEWTSSDFLPYPGFRAFPYREYSEVFWGGDYKVLRGGSWAADHLAVRGTFRNWDHPIRRQIFAGFRCARDADG
jgi:gamma-glutamyl hercynylcysteine S-oxide synthase